MTTLYWILLTIAIVLAGAFASYVALEGHREKQILQQQLELLEKEKQELQKRRDQLNREINVLRKSEREALDRLARVPVGPEEEVVSDVLREAMNASRR